MTDLDLTKEMMFWCRHIDPELEHSPYPRTRWAGDGRVEVSCCCRNGSGTEICGEFSTDPEEAMQSLIDAIKAHLFSGTTPEERLSALYRNWIKAAICQGNEKDREFFERRLRELEGE